MPKHQWTPELIEQCQYYAQVPFHADSQTQRSMEKDFGHLVQGHCSAAVYPQNSQQLVNIIHFAYYHGLPLTPRGNGLCQGGQSVAYDGSVVVVLTELNRINQLDMDNMQIHCQTGASWGNILRACLPCGVVPKVTMSYADITLGGTLAVGGIGPNTHRYGPVSNNVEKLQLITGQAEQYLCTKTYHQELFYAALKGLSEVGIITDVYLKLRHYKPFTRTFVLLYDDFRVCVEDQMTLSKYRPCDHLETFGAPCVPGSGINQSNKRHPLLCWFYALHVSYEFDQHQQPPTLGQLRYLHYYQCVDISDTTTDEFLLEHHQIRYDTMHMTGAWQQYHPWMDYIVDGHILSQHLPQLLESYITPPIAEFRMQPINNDNQAVLSDKVMSQPMAFALLPQGVPQYYYNMVLSPLKNFNQAMRHLGAYRYPSGWLRNEDRIITWFDNQFDQMRVSPDTLAKRYNPRALFTRLSERAINNGSHI